MSQHDDIINYLRKNKSMTKAQGLRYLNIMNVGARIGELRDKGYNIETERIKVRSGKTVARYWLREEEKNAEQDH